jgi:DNA-binding response OmpR family regulator
MVAVRAFIMPVRTVAQCLPGEGRCGTGGRGSDLSVRAPHASGKGRRARHECLDAGKVTPIRQNILLLEPDPAVREVLVDYLSCEHGLAVTAAGTLHVAAAALKADASAFDALILSVAMPDGDACDFCARLRLEGHDTIVIIMTGQNEETDIVRALDAGANDYVARPFRLHELLARLHAQWRIGEGVREAAYPLGPYTFRPSAKALCDAAGNPRVSLTPKEVAVLKFLFLSKGRPVSREELLRQVWGYNDGVATHTVETHMHRLRQKIETAPRYPSLLLSDRDGYRINLAAEAGGR